MRSLLGEVRMARVRMDFSHTGGEGSGDRERYPCYSVSTSIERRCPVAFSAFIVTHLMYMPSARLASRRALQTPGDSLVQESTYLFLAGGLEIETEDIAKNLHLY